MMSALVVAGMIAGCGATSHVGATQSPAPVIAAHTSNVPTAWWAKAPKRQLGLDMDYYSGPGLNVAAYAQADVQYIKSLHGNALSVSFPFFMHGWYANGVYVNANTPSANQLGLVAKAARAGGLYFSIRPLLDESSLHHKGGRTHWSPQHPAAWFASYEKFLRPYALMAQKDHVSEFIIGVEFDKINNSPFWGKVAAYVRKYYHGTIGYADNWEMPIPNRVNRAGIVQSVDAYPPMKAMPPSSSVSRLTAAWDSYLRTKARGVVVSELGIAAQNGAYERPFRLIWPGEPLNPVIQARWFTAACNAVANERAGGIYFWSINLAQIFNKPPVVSDPTQFVDGKGASAISACFKHLG
ncbi:MAG TPA: hypothetical protein VGI66_06590 [Streptosporangiaceae bacterium]